MFETHGEGFCWSLFRRWGLGAVVAAAASSASAAAAAAAAATAQRHTVHRVKPHNSTTPRRGTLGHVRTSQET